MSWLLMMCQLYTGIDKTSILYFSTWWDFKQKTVNMRTEY